MAVRKRHGHDGRISPFVLSVLSVPMAGPGSHRPTAVTRHREVRAPPIATVQKGTDMRKLIVAVFVVASLWGTPSAMALNNAQDDKNNPTYPGGAGDKRQRSWKAADNTAEHCDAFVAGERGNGANYPAQCYQSP